MKIQTFRDKKGLIYGSDPKRIGCDKSGVLKIGTTTIGISANIEAIMPLLYHGCSGNYDATFTTLDGTVYTLERVAVRNGWIQPPSKIVLDMMELHCRADAAEEERDYLKAKIVELQNIFDTDALNFLIKGENK